MGEDIGINIVLILIVGMIFWIAISAGKEEKHYTIEDYNITALKKKRKRKVYVEEVKLSEEEISDREIRGCDSLTKEHRC